MNRMHLMVAIQRHALEGDTDADSIYGKLRKDFFGKVNSGHGELMSRPQVQAFAKQAIAQAEAAFFPIEKARLALDIREGELRADILDAIQALPTANPRDCRDVYDLHQKIGGSVGEPTCREALEMLAAGGIDVSALTAKADELWPKEPDDAEVAA